MNLIATTAWTLARSSLGRLLLGGCLLLALLWFAQARGRAMGHAEGVIAERAAWEARAAAAADRAQAAATRHAAVEASIGAAVIENQAAARLNTRTLIYETPRYVPPEADARCDVPVGLVRLHDAAAAGLSTPANAADSAAEAASGLALSAVAETVVDNYGACREAVEQLKGWQAWWAAVSQEGDR